MCTWNNSLLNTQGRPSANLWGSCSVQHSLLHCCPDNYDGLIGLSLSLVNSWNPQVLPNFTFFMLQPGSSFNRIRFSNVRADLICFCLSEIIVPCCLMFSVLITIVSCNIPISFTSISTSIYKLFFRWEGKSGNGSLKKFKKFCLFFMKLNLFDKPPMLSFICPPLTFQP